MIDWFGVSGKLKTLTDRLTSARAANLDNLNATITSTAPASTALSNVTWTSALAAILNNTIQTSILSGNIQTGYATGGVGGSGEDSSYVDVTITAVAATAKCIVLVNGDANGNVITARLTSTTNLRISAPGYGGFGITARWYVIPLK